MTSPFCSESMKYCSSKVLTYVNAILTLQLQPHVLHIDQGEAEAAESKWR
jgi:hypothetical protein